MKKKFTMPTPTPTPTPPPSHPQTQHVALHMNFLIIAVMRNEGTWKAYGTPVPGQNHRNEAPLYWQRDGEQLSEHNARHFFTHLSDVPYAS
jgi:hypothetical protein